MLNGTTNLLDPLALAIVLLGTAMATMAREGWQDIGVAVSATFKLGQKGFEENATKAALARNVGAFNRLGHLSAEPIDPPDQSTQKLLNTYIRSGSIDAMMRLARTQRMEREIASVTATRAYETAGELAPVFGLVGTLVAITQLMPDMNQSSTDIVMASMAGAVLSTLYGVLSANLLFYPLARAIERRGDHEEAARSHLLEWFESELSDGRGNLAHNPRKIPEVRGAA